MFKLNFLVLYFTSIEESNKNATDNLRFLNFIEDENDSPKLIGVHTCLNAWLGQRKVG